MNITFYILQCNQSEPLADASGRIVDLMNENGYRWSAALGNIFMYDYDLSADLQRRCSSIKSTLGECLVFAGIG